MFRWHKHGSLITWLPKSCKAIHFSIHRFAAFQINNENKIDENNKLGKSAIEKINGVITLGHLKCDLCRKRLKSSKWEWICSAKGCDVLTRNGHKNIDKFVRRFALKPLCAPHTTHGLLRMCMCVSIGRAKRSDSIGHFWYDKRAMHTCETVYNQRASRIPHFFRFLPLAFRCIIVVAVFLPFVLFIINSVETLKI